MKKKDRPIINLGCCRYDILRVAAKNAGFIVDERADAFDNDLKSFDLYWMDKSSASSRVRKLFGYQTINHFPYIDRIANRLRFSAGIKPIQDRFPEDYSFHLRSWVIDNREHMNDFRNYHSLNLGLKENTYIIKPKFKNAFGKGIRVIQDVQEIKGSYNSIIQTYVDRPLLMDERKFDLRFLFLLSSVSPLTLHMFKKGFVRVSKEKYEPPKPENLVRNDIHITVDNQTGFPDHQIKSEDGTFRVGGRRCFNYFKKWLEDNNGPSYDSIIKKVEEIAIKSVIIGSGQIQRVYKESMTGNKNGGSFTCFEVLGFDIILDSQFNVFLLDICHSPSYNTHGELDLEVKTELATNTLKILGIDREDREKVKFSRNDRMEQLERRKQLSEESEGYTKIFPTREYVKKFRHLLKHQKVEIGMSEKEKLLELGHKTLKKVEEFRTFVELTKHKVQDWRKKLHELFDVIIDFTPKAIKKYQGVNKAFYKTKYALRGTSQKFTKSKMATSKKDENLEPLMRVMENYKKVVDELRTYVSDTMKKKTKIIQSGKKYPFKCKIFTRVFGKKEIFNSNDKYFSVFYGELGRFGKPDGYGFVIQKRKNIITRKSTWIKIFDGEMKNGERSGKGREYSIYKGSVEIIYEGLFHSGHKHGRGLQFTNKGNSIIGIWKAGKLDKREDEFQLHVLPIKKFDQLIRNGKILGAGTWGKVYAVELKKKKYALKTIDLPFNNPHRSLETLERLKRSIRRCSKFNHNNVITVYGMILEKVKLGKVCGCLMELGEKSLDVVIREFPRPTLDRKIKILYDVAMGMEYLHETQQVMHRDLKPGNIILDFSGNAKISDMDELRDCTSWKLTSTATSGVGTPVYVAPEVFTTGNDFSAVYDKRCDIFSFGIMICAILKEKNNPYSDLRVCKCGTKIRNIQAGVFAYHTGNCSLRPIIEKEYIQKIEEENKGKSINWIIELMNRCWETKPDNRPSFKQIVRIFDFHFFNRKDSFLEAEFYTEDEEGKTRMIFETKLVDFNFEDIMKFLRDKYKTSKILGISLMENEQNIELSEGMEDILSLIKRTRFLEDEDEGDMDWEDNTMEEHEGEEDNDGGDDKEFSKQQRKIVSCKIMIRFENRISGIVKEEEKSSKKFNERMIGNILQIEEKDKEIDKLKNLLIDAQKENEVLEKEIENLQEENELLRKKVEENENNT